ncbi:histidine phosphatase family protein [Pleionea sp. CnH1-48]|uniref:histidine phosphatase family protein n=1 Tax=Pleionea sp. CnH1-48 TaxID=2954494 RepID=UPI002098544A|nr:histidine phosphatase family protein [Pleionea sp. CnH1-48]MCO7227037.1 histidine phosphatase family protein [Pleionea sp. CnH1-48]
MTLNLYCLRHGQPTGDPSLLGITDRPLSDHGWQQMRNNVSQISELHQVISSPLSRCSAFAQEWTDEQNLPLLIDPSWSECNFGQWDGMTYHSLWQNHKDEMQSFWQSPEDFTPPQGEPLAQFTQRIEQALLKLEQNYQGQNVLLIAHAGVIRTLIAWTLNMDYHSASHLRRISLDYGSITHISIFRDDDGVLWPRLVGMNHSVESVHAA